MKKCDFNFVCEKRWDNLKKTENPIVRHCIECQKDVHLVSSEDQFVFHAKKGNCVALFIDKPPKIKANPHREYQNELLTKTEILHRVAEIFNNFENVSNFPLHLWKISFMESLESAYNSGYMVRADVFKNFDFKPDENSFDEITVILNEHGIAFYENDFTFGDMVELLGLPKFAINAPHDIDPILLRPIEELNLHNVIIRKLFNNQVSLIKDILPLKEADLSEKYGLTKEEIIFVNEELHSRGLTLGMKINDIF